MCVLGYKTETLGDENQADAIFVLIHHQGHSSQPGTHITVCRVVAPLKNAQVERLIQ